MMNSSFIKHGLVTATLLFSFNTGATVNEQHFKVAVMESAAGSKEIMKGDYELGLKKLAKARLRQTSKFDAAMGNCAGKIMTNELEQAKINCSDAINTYKSKVGYDYKFLTSMAYSNRGVAKYRLGDFSGALDDMNFAVELNDNKIVQENLSYLKSKLATQGEAISKLAGE